MCPKANLAMQSTIAPCSTKRRYAGPARRTFRDKASTVSVNQETRRVMQQFLTQPILSVRRLINAACSFAFCRTWLQTGLRHSEARPSPRSSTATAVSNRHRFASSSILSGGGEERWRPIAVLTIHLVATTLGTLTHLSGFTPWSPRMNASSGDSVPQQPAWQYRT